MKVMLIQPKFETHLITPPLGLGYLASSLFYDGHDVRLFDCVCCDVDIIKEIQDLSPDFIGISVLSASYTSVIELIKEIKKISNAKIVIGGIHASALPEQSLRDTKADYCIIGEGEITFRELIKKEIQEVDGLAYIHEGKFIINKSRELIKNLDDIKFPAWFLISPNKYPPTPHGAFYKYFPIAPIITTRGCPYDCIFCASKCMWKQKLRVRSTKNVVDEIELLHKKYGVREFHIEDDNFTFSKSHAMEICDEIKRRKLNIVWACPNGVRIDRLDKELIECMKDSGCYSLSFGIESGNQQILNSINKHLDLNIVPEIIDMVKEEGIVTCGFFMIGLPEDTRETINDTINFALSLGLDRAQFSRFTPLPGTKVFDDWYGDNKENFSWDKMNVIGESNYRNKNLTGKEIDKLQQEAFRRFYLRPKMMYKTLLNIKLNQISWILKRLKDYKI